MKPDRHLKVVTDTALLAQSLDARIDNIEAAMGHEFQQIWQDIRALKKDVEELQRDVAAICRRREREIL